MTLDSRQPGYILGNTDTEHERLIRRAVRLAQLRRVSFAKPGLDLDRAFSTLAPELEM
jgi:hypothetical protein